MTENKWDKTLIHFNGYLALTGVLLAVAGALFGLLRQTESITVVCVLIGIFLLSGFRVVQPNIALVSTLFGRYSGVLTESGFFWIVPFYSTQKVSLRTANYVTPTLKVNDSAGNPIEIAAAIVYHIGNPAAAVLDVEDATVFIQVQCESALRTLASHHPYTAEGESLSRHSEQILAQFQQMVQERVDFAGIEIDEARFTHLAYAAEIAQVMLRRQQAESVVAARATLVHGAIAMVESTLHELSERKIVEMNNQEKARLVTNMMSVLLSEESAAPVVNVGD